jgi:hypothetical protein
VSYLSANPDGGLVAGCEQAARVAGGGGLGFLIRVWDLAGGAPAAVLHGHGGEVNALAWDTGLTDVLYSVADDGTLRSWDVGGGAAWEGEGGGGGGGGSGSGGAGGSGGGGGDDGRGGVEGGAPHPAPPPSAAAAFAAMYAPPPPPAPSTATAASARCGIALHPRGGRAGAAKAAAAAAAAATAAATSRPAPGALSADAFRAAQALFATPCKVLSLSVAPGGGVVATVDEEGVARLWRTASCATRALLRSPQLLFELPFKSYSRAREFEEGRWRDGGGGGGGGGGGRGAAAAAGASQPAAARSYDVKFSPAGGALAVACKETGEVNVMRWARGACEGGGAEEGAQRPLGMRLPIAEAAAFPARRDGAHELAFVTAVTWTTDGGSLLVAACAVDPRTDLEQTRARCVRSPLFFPPHPSRRAHTHTHTRTHTRTG